MSFKVLCVDDDEALLNVVCEELAKGFDVDKASSLSDAFQKLSASQFDCVLLDANLPDAHGIQGLEKIKKAFHEISVIMLTAEKDPKLIVKAMHLGASDYIIKPFEIEELTFILKRLATNLRTKQRFDALVANTGEAETCGRIFLGKSPQFCELLAQTKRLKGHDANVLITGESGTGKELLARYIHALDDPLQSRPFITVNCAAIPDNLLESELFGHERGAFTGAHMRKIGKFELSDGGDIFLDEVATLKPEMQAKILRAIQEKEITRLGSNTSIRTSFRVIAATNEDLASLVERRLFRLDLYYRLKVVELFVPPLRARRSDIADLAEFFLQRYSHDGRLKHLSGQAMERLKSYSWPGNVRELENTIHGAVILAAGDTIEVDDLPNLATMANVAKNADLQNNSTTELGFKDYIKCAERTYIERTLAKCLNDRTLTAKTMGISRASLYVKLKELGIK